jgi:hypothetical protein
LDYSQRLQGWKAIECTNWQFCDFIAADISVEIEENKVIPLSVAKMLRAS